MRALSLFASIALLGACATAPAASPPSTPHTEAAALPHGEGPAWQRWSRETFARARTEQRIIVVTIATEWCHWCHVMDEKTWADPEVSALVDARFIAIREDADARPDLAERYADWGWPATAILSPDGGAVMELRGFQDRTTFLPLLRALVEKLDRGEKLERPAATVAITKSPLDEIRAFTQAQLDRVYDDVAGGWGAPQKYPFWAPVEAALAGGALRGDAAQLARGLQTLDQHRSLIDPIDGGMFQYSLDGKWTAPHTEKLAEVNGANAGAFALGFLATKDTRYADAGRALHRYLTSTLRDPSGAFYANQDADLGTRGDATRMTGKAWYALSADERRKAGTPFVDKNVYASHNGRVIAGLARFAGATGDRAILDDATGAARAILATHARTTDAGLAFAHARGDDAIVHLADQVTMGAAFVELFEATGERVWLERARDVVRATRASLADGDGAFFAHTVGPDTPELDRRKPLRANAEAARLLMKVGRFLEDKEMVDAGVRALEAFSSEAVVKGEGRLVGEYLLALEEARAEPLHFAVVGTPDDAGTRALHAAALRVWSPHRLVEILPPGDKYPDLGKAALYICGSSFCSPPITDPALVEKKAVPFLKPRA